MNMDIEEDELNDTFFPKYEIKSLDSKWLKEFEKTDQIYQDYYKDDNHYTNIHYIYVNKNNEIDKIRQEFIYMSKPNYVVRDEMIGLLKRNSIDSNIRYTLLSILKINITLEPSEIKPFLMNTNLDYYKDAFFTPITNIDTIVFEKTISMFQDLNDIFIIFYEKNNTISENGKPKNITKKIYLHTNPNKRKTIRKPI